MDEELQPVEKQLQLSDDSSQTGSGCWCLGDDADERLLVRPFHLGHGLELLRQYYNIKRGFASAAYFVLLYVLVVGKLHAHPD